MPFPTASYRYAEGPAHLGQVRRARPARLPRPGAFVTAELVVAVHAREDGPGWASAAGQCIAAADFGAGLAPRDPLAAALAAAAPLRVPADLVGLHGAWGEFRFGPPDPVTGYQAVTDWRPAGGVAGRLAALPAPVGGPAANLFRQAGRGFEVRFSPPDGRPEEAAPPDSKGLRHYARLLRTPGRAVAALELVGGRPARPARLEVSGQEALDRDALRAIFAELQETTADLDAARRDGDAAAAERLAGELHQLQERLRADRGLGRKARKLRGGDAAGRAAAAVAEALARAGRALRAGGTPRLAEHLDRSVHHFAGQFVYSPASDFPGWEF